MTNEEKLDKILEYCVWKLDNNGKIDKVKLDAVCVEVTGNKISNNTEFRRYVTHIIDRKFANVYDDPIATIEGKKFIGFVEEAKVKKQLEDRDNKIAELTLENGRLSSEISKFQIEHYPFLLDEAKNRKKYFWINLIVGGLLAIVGVILGAHLKEAPSNPIDLPSIQEIHDTAKRIEYRIIHDTVRIPVKPKK